MRVERKRLGREGARPLHIAALGEGDRQGARGVRIVGIDLQGAKMRLIARFQLSAHPEGQSDAMVSARQVGIDAQSLVEGFDGVGRAGELYETMPDIGVGHRIVRRLGDRFAQNPQRPLKIARTLKAVRDEVQHQRMQVVIEIGALCELHRAGDIVFLKAELDLIKNIDGQGRSRRLCNGKRAAYSISGAGAIRLHRLI